MRHVIRASLEWLAFPLILCWLCLVYAPWHVVRWCLYGDTPRQERHRRIRRQQQIADWSAIEQAMTAELAARKWPDTPRYRSILLSGRWGKK